MEREDIVIGGKNFLDNNITNCSHFLWGLSRGMKEPGKTLSPQESVMEQTDLDAQ